MASPEATGGGPIARGEKIKWEGKPGGPPQVSREGSSLRKDTEQRQSDR